MRNTPKSNYQKLQQVSNAWETLASSKSFGGMTFTQFQEATAPSTAARNQIDDLEDQLTQALYRS